MHPAGRALIGFWTAALILTGGTILVLRVLGPPPLPKPASVPHAAPLAPVAASMARPVAVASAAASGAIAPPDPALLEPAPDYPSRMLPIAAADGRTPARTYAAGAATATGPRIAILIEGFGLSDDLDRQALDQLPAAVSFGISPHSDALLLPGDPPLLQHIRAAGHETWLSLPMEPAGSPLDSEGPNSLSLSLDLAVDAKALEWSLSRFEGYVGVTNALSGLRGDRFAASGAFAMVAKQLDQRGLLYADAGLAPHELPAVEPAHARIADLTLDEQPDATDIAARLDRLEQIALAHGSAFGVAGPLRPVTIERLRAWSRGLHERGITLVPLSALPDVLAQSGTDTKSPP